MGNFLSLPLDGAISILAIITWYRAIEYNRYTASVSAKHCPIGITNFYVIPPQITLIVALASLRLRTGIAHVVIAAIMACGWSAILTIWISRYMVDYLGGLTSK